jgi:drug/metabolite transporter (DMT)-like permease
MELKKKKGLQAEAALLLVAFIWGSTFVIIKDALTGVTPMVFNSFRFLIAAFFILIIFRRNSLRLKQVSLKAGLKAGVFLFLGYSLQTLGLQFTSAGKAGFITGLCVVIVPLLVGIKNRRLPPTPALLGAALAAFGLAFLSLDGSQSFNRGDVLVLGCAFAFAFHIISVGEFAEHSSSETLTLLQIGSVGLFSLFWSGTTGQLAFRLSLPVWGGIIFCALAATALAYLIQTKAQKITSPTRTALIFSTEPVFGALFAYLYAGELLTVKALLGCLIILMGMLFAELG